MLNCNRLILSLCLLCACFGTARAASLDEMYRDIVRSDNSGYLPMFVKNRSLPDVLMEEEILKKLPPEVQTAVPAPAPVPINLTNDRAAREAAARAAQQRWADALKAVQFNQVTPLVLEEIHTRVTSHDPKAVEVLAFMNARGIGIETNFLRAYELYQLAAKLGVPKAADNARAVWNVMTVEQRRALRQLKS